MSHEPLFKIDLSKSMQGVRGSAPAGYTDLFSTEEPTLTEGRMPIYEFLCDDCGHFEERRSFEEAGDPAACPDCESAARRVYAMPNLKTMPTPLSNAMHRSEKSAYEPEVAWRPEGGTLPGKRYRPGHGGHHGHNH